MSWEREMIEACCDPSCYHMQRNKAFKEARAACIAELLSDPQDESDHAYDRAIKHCIAAIDRVLVCWYCRWLTRGPCPYCEADIPPASKGTDG